MGRIKGNTTPLFTLKTGAGTVQDLSQDVVSIGTEAGDGSPLTMADFAAGLTPKNLVVTFALRFDLNSAWDYLWTNAGASGSLYVLQLNTGTVSQTNPKFTGTLTMPAKPDFAVEAGTDEATFEATFVLDGTPTKAIA